MLVLFQGVKEISFSVIPAGGREVAGGFGRVARGAAVAPTSDSGLAFLYKGGAAGTAKAQGQDFAGHPGPSLRSTVLPLCSDFEYRRNLQRRPPSRQPEAVGAGGLSALYLRSLSCLGNDLLFL